MSRVNVRLDSPDTSDHEGDTFVDAEDAQNTMKRPGIDRPQSSISNRSLTERSPSAASSVRSLTARLESGTPSKPSSRPSLRMASKSTSESIIEESAPVGQMENTTFVGAGKAQDRSVSPEYSDDGKGNGSRSLQSTARPVSARFDEVHLTNKEPIAVNEDRGRPGLPASPTPPRSLSVSSQGAPAKTPSRTPNLSVSSSTGFSSWGATSKTMPPPMSKKLSGPWNFFSRKKTESESKSPPPMSRRDTTATMASIGSNPDFLLSKMDNDRASGLPAKETLKERFKMARMKEESGINSGLVSPATRSSVSTVAGGLNGISSQLSSETGLGIKSQDTMAEEGASSVITSPTHKSRTSSVSLATTFDPKLAPGTVAGLSTGPSIMQDPEVPVDWDLWQSVVYEGPAAVAKTSAAELNGAIASGIPSPIRGVVWQVLAQSKNEALESVYRELVNRGTDKEIAGSPNPSAASGPLSAFSVASTTTQKDSVASSSSSVHSEHSSPATTNGPTSPTASHENDAKLQVALAAEREKKAKEDSLALRKLEKTIRKDLGSRSNYSKYFAAKDLQDDLFGVCKAYALYDDGVGYAQGMNFIVMPILFNMPAEEAFCLLVRLMNHYQLREMFIQDMPGLHLHLYQFERILEDLEPALCYHLRKRGITPGLYATQWFLTLFAYRFPLQLVLRVYDLILSEGLGSAILKFGIGVMQRNSEVLLAMQDMSALKTFLNEKLFDAYIDAAPSSNSILEQGFFGNSGGSEKEVYRADVLVQDACNVRISPEVLKTYADEYEAKMRLEKDREAELEKFKTTTATQAAKIRSLESRAEKADTDHVQMATEMIHSKMENEELRTTNQELSIRIEGLENIIGSQPEEVEKRLKAEMERIMARNIEVQNENRALEEQMAEMEQDLVGTKMRFAEMNSDHDTLKQKWSDLRRALDG